MDVAELTGLAIAKRLASCRKATQQRALCLLVTWLSSANSASISDEVLLKIWKGLFYCMWHADKQIELVNRLSSLLVALDLPLSARYLEAFLTTIRREWSGIDQLRLDKFYLLIRKFINHFFAFLSDKKWDKEVVGRMTSVLEERTLLSVDKYPAQGINYYISQVYLDEIAEFLPLSVESLEALMKPFLTVMEKSLDKVLLNKIKSYMFDRLIENGRKYLELGRKNGVELRSEVEKFGKIALALGFSKKFFASAMAPEILTSNRRVLFNLQHSFLKLGKDLENSGVKFSLELENRGISTDAPLKKLPLGSGCGEHGKLNTSNDDASSDERSSKKKKLKKVSSRVGKKSSNKNGKKSSHLVYEGSAFTCTSAPANVGVDINGNMNVDEIDDSVVLLDKTALSNLHMQFEKVAAEAGMITPVNSMVPNKRKRSKSTDKAISIVDGNALEKSGEKTGKKVRFSLKNNLVWKPQTPLPPQSLRLPPSAIPRGSALKKGLPSGPIRKSPPSSKNTKVNTRSKKKSPKVTHGISPAVKRLRKLQSRSAYGV